jgi:hypothetical protein
MKFKHQVSVVNKAEKVGKILWSDERDDFDFKRLNYELHRCASLDLKNKDSYIGIIQFNGHEWILGTDRNIVLPSGEKMFFLDKWLLSPVELAFLKEHSNDYLSINEIATHSSNANKYISDEPRHPFLYEQVNKDSFRFGLLKSEKNNSELKGTFAYTEILDLEFGFIKPEDCLILFSEYANSDPENQFTDAPGYAGTDLVLTITTASDAYSEIGKAYLNNLPLKYIGLSKFEKKSDAVSYVHDSINLLKRRMKTKT